jgi:hypothetical protein
MKLFTYSLRLLGSQEKEKVESLISPLKQIAVTLVFASAYSDRLSTLRSTSKTPQRG